MESKAKDHLAGHRDRLRTRLREVGPKALRDDEILELLLFGVLPRRDTKTIAKDLLARFGTLSALFGASEAAIMEVGGSGPVVAAHLKIIHAIQDRLLRADASSQPVLSSWSAVLNYARHKLQHLEREEFHVLFLDKRLRLAADEKMSEGTIDQAPVYPREIARRALELSAASVILVHNHPSGDPTPSSADVALTREIVSALKPLDVAVHDHVVVGREGAKSLKALGLM